MSIEPDFSRSRRTRACLAGLIFALGGVEGPVAQGVPSVPGQYAKADIEHGSRIYALQCASCHGPTGNSVAGIDLRTGQLHTRPPSSKIRTRICGT